MYIRTNGINGNISANTLAVLSEPDMWKNSSDSVYNKLSTDNFVVTNPSAATNGYNPESIDSAYNNYKKTIGTFDTLVTCRDYMNKIYQLTEDDVNTTPLVSNVIVSDIRDDINRSYTLCEFSDYGIKYVDKTYKDDNQQDLINHFDLVLYPFRTVATSNSEESYVNSFKYSAENSIKIENDLEKYKTISHSIKYPKEDEIACIKNYLKLNAKITTVLKVNTTEEISILSSIYNAIYNNFNLRKLDFGESIPFDDILTCIENADTRIKNVSLDEPILYTVFVTADNTEYSIESSIPEKLLKAKVIYNKLALRNILAGKIALFNYNEDFKYEYSEKNNSSYDPIYPAPTSSNKIISLQPELILNTSALLPYTLNDNEVIQFRAPSFKTSKTYPAYVNYFIHLNDDSSGSSDEEEGIPALFKSMQVFLREAVGVNDDR
ncbi:MAG: hypothetical protein J6W64_01575 [Bacilli bacterium]|nr:hypothetical protein [Bacilli bacterium]